MASFQFLGAAAGSPYIVFIWTSGVYIYIYIKYGFESVCNGKFIRRNLYCGQEGGCSECRKILESQKCIRISFYEGEFD